jgi:diguanylate cyclase (GGDEF)-like protein
MLGLHRQGGESMQGVLAALLLGMVAWLSSPAHATARPDFEIEALAASVADPMPGSLVSGALDSRFEPFSYRDVRLRGGPFWLKLKPVDAPSRRTGEPTVMVHKGRHLHVQLFANRAGAPVRLAQPTELPGFSGVHGAVFLLPHDVESTQPLYALVEPTEGLGGGAEELRFSSSSLEHALTAKSEHERMIAFSFGALMAMSLAAALIWFVLKDSLFILYAALISLQALYMAYFSGEGFEWPLFSSAVPLDAYAWNVPVALSGAIACLFVRDIADLKRFSPRVYTSFGWLAIAFVVLAVANLGDAIGLGRIVAAVGNVVFLGAAAFTLIVAFMAWRRGNRAAGWFLIAWVLLETVTIAVAVRLLFTEPEGAEGLLYYGLPLSMVAAAVFVALGVADRLREQRVALSDAERRARTDALTGVLNRRSILERLEAASARAQARGLPIALLFIDLDHFKDINDTHGHAAGDDCLRAIIGPIQSELRQSDVIGRYGGEEFLVILSSADAAAAHPIAQRILQRVAEVRVEGHGAPIRLTCSIGVATSDTMGIWGQPLIASADAAVYAAKRFGRNRVEVATPLAA